MYNSLPLEKVRNSLHSLGKAHPCSNEHVKLELLKIIIKLCKNLEVALVFA